jgi:hypothetical protein
MTTPPIDPFMIERLQDGGWRVIRRKADLTDLPIADFVSYGDAEEWVNWSTAHAQRGRGQASELGSAK